MRSNQCMYLNAMDKSFNIVGSLEGRVSKAITQESEREKREREREISKR